MRSNLLKTVFILLVLFVSAQLLTSCSYFFEEKQKENEISYNEKTGGCLGRANHTLKLYFDLEQIQEVSDEEIDKFQSCYADTINSIVSNTISGRVDGDKYSAENFDLLMQRLHPELALGVERIENYIALKSFLVGGDRDKVSKDELKTLMGFLPHFAGALKNLKVHRDTLYQLKDYSRDQENYQQFEKVFSDLKTNMTHLVSVLKKHRGDRQLDLNYFGEFLLREFYGEEVVADKLKYVDLLISFKNLVLNKSDQHLNAKDLGKFVSQTTYTYKALLSYNMFIRDQDIFTNLGTLVSFITKIPGQLRDSSMFKGVTLDAIHDVIAYADKVLSRSARIDNKQKIDFVRLEDFILKLEAADYMGGGRLTARTLNYFIKRFSKTWLTRSSQRTSDFTSEKLAYIKRMMARWCERQKLLNEIYGTDNKVSLASLPGSFSDNSLIKKWRELFSQVSLYRWDDLKRVSLQKNINDLSYEEMTASNSVQLLIELFMRPYNYGERDLFKFKVTKPQAQAIYDVVRILGVEMAFMDSRVFNSGERAFDEINNFSSLKDNNDFMSFFEGYEWLSLAISSGRLADRIHDGVDDRYHLNYLDVLFQPVTEAPYFRNYLAENFSHFFNHLQQVSTYWSEASGDEKTAFLQTLEIASRRGVISEKPYDLVEIRTLSTILSYLESIFYVFDRNKDGVAEKQELIAAELHFKSLIKDFILKSSKPLLETHRDRLLGFMLPGDQNRIVRERLIANGRVYDELALWLTPRVFIYLLEYGDIPRGLSLAFLRLLMSEDRVSHQFQTVQASVHDVLKVFSALAKISHESHIKQIQDFLVSQHKASGAKGLIDEIDQQEAPDCQEFPETQFCLWARVIYCNEIMNEELYQWMTNNRYILFPQEEWDSGYDYTIDYAKENFDSLGLLVRRQRGVMTSEELRESLNGVARSTMAKFEFTFLNHKKFSTQCSFPRLEGVDLQATVVPETNVETANNSASLESDVNSGVTSSQEEPSQDSSHDQVSQSQEQSEEGILGTINGLWNQVTGSSEESAE